jgi:galactose oxidase
LATAPVAKARHSTAILLPDGRVWSAGGDGYLPDRTELQIYSPPYLFQGNRPTITSAPAKVLYNQKFSVATPQSRHIAKAALIKLGTATHDGTFDQRYVLLDFKAKGGMLRVTSPVDSAHAPPGYYMLFIVTDRGIPSVASMILVQ